MTNVSTPYSTRGRSGSAPAGVLQEKSSTETASQSDRASGLNFHLSEVPVEHVDPERLTQLMTLSEPRGLGADRIRYLRMHLRTLSNAGKLKSLVVTSALPSDGKSTISLNLAAALAEGGDRSVLLVEADLHQPALAATLNIESKPGISECIENNVKPLTAVRRIDPANFYLMEAGKTKSNPSELVQSDKFAATVSQLTPHFDWVIYDTPPVEPLTDALCLSRLTDGILFVVWAGRTPRRAVERAIEKIGRRRLVGIVLNGAEGLNSLYAKYRSYYGKGR